MHHMFYHTLFLHLQIIITISIIIITIINCLIFLCSGLYQVITPDKLVMFCAPELQIIISGNHHHLHIWMNIILIRFMNIQNIIFTIRYQNYCYSHYNYIVITSLLKAHNSDLMLKIWREILFTMGICQWTG